MAKFNKFLAFIGFAIIVLCAFVQFNAHYAFLTFLEDIRLTSSVATYVPLSFIFIFSFLNLFKKKLIPIILITLLTLAFILVIIMTSFPDVVLKIIPAK